MLCRRLCLPSLCNHHFLEVSKNTFFSSNKLRCCEQMSSRISDRSFDRHDTRNTTRCAMRSSRTHSGPAASSSFFHFSSASFPSCARAGGGIGPATPRLVLKGLFFRCISCAHRSHLPQLDLHKERTAIFFLTWASSRPSAILCRIIYGGCLSVVAQLMNYLLLTVSRPRSYSSILLCMKLVFHSCMLLGRWVAISGPHGKSARPIVHNRRHPRLPGLPLMHGLTARGDLSWICTVS